MTLVVHSAISLASLEVEASRKFKTLPRPETTKTLFVSGCCVRISEAWEERFGRSVMSHW